MKSNDVLITESDSSSFDYVMDIEKRAFGCNDEARLTANLLQDKSAEPIVSLLAYYHDIAVGHILFTRAYINNLSRQPLIHILAPLAVVPEYQKQGIGGLLIKAGLSRLREMGSGMVFVLGHINYYPRYGFIPNAGALGYSAPYPIPDEFSEAWMVQPLKPEVLEMEKGKVLCAMELDKPEYWRE